ncbi:SdiA-regulated domain-containing protein [Candidatus Sulfidibacterium hydrothermale]|uniref:SdiA-regulated domain-containing protein n=1 Tax=Candidatus Sulfidibacterium hydrothermale TaxID=2875962 RepID=UPI001F0B1255|nr:SdiA-regulated domain-containing protein [Candidatus Sulfidibacterium hydrothermale]UBM61160.1 SdiA-regulated domain-containing protein [Candidatus Sulfidibacterium hydrothermale]
MNGKLTIWILALLSVPFSVFAQENGSDILFVRNKSASYPYQLAHPDKRWKLPEKLKEISGLSLISRHKLACVQDEKGIIYVFNTKKGEVVKQIKFGEKGDYEGIEIVGNDAWVLKSNGTLYEVKDFLKKKNPKVVKYNTILSGRNNAEGLGYDTVHRQLLIACKGYPFPEGDEIENLNPACFKAVYRFPLATKKLDKTPALLIALDTIKQYKGYNTLTRAGIALLAFLDASEGDVSFKPSAIAIEPGTGNYYILASSGNALAVFSADGVLLSLATLRSKVHIQPEGICFGPGGTLYIANEGKDSKGKIYRFNRRY